MARLSLVGGTVVTPGTDGTHDLAEGTVIVEDGVIVDVAAGRSGSGRRIDCRGKLVLPGFVNAHAHTTEVLFRGLGGTLDHVEWVDRKHRLQRAVDESGAEVGTRLACLEMLRSGVVAFLDPEVLRTHLRGVERAADASGLKAGLALSFEARHGYGTAGNHGTGHDHGTAGNHGTGHDRGAAGDHGTGHDHGSAPEVAMGSRHGRVVPWLGPRAMSAMTVELADAIGRRAAADRVPVTFHCSEDHRDHDAVREEYGMTPTAFAHHHGLLGRRSVLAHGVYLERDDLPLIAAAGATVVHCPVSNAKTGKGVAALNDLLAAGINVALGTDGGMCNDSYDVLQELRMAGLVHRAANRDSTATNPELLLDMVTENGAQVLETGGGAVEPGRAADIVVIDLHRLGSWPTQNAIDSLTFSATRHVVEMVLVDGEVLLEAGRTTTIDEDATLRDAEGVARDATASALSLGERRTLVGATRRDLHGTRNAAPRADITGSRVSILEAD